MCSVQCAVCSVQCAVCSVQCAVCSVKCAVFASVECAVCSVRTTRVLDGQIAVFPNSSQNRESLNTAFISQTEQDTDGWRIAALNNNSLQGPGVKTFYCLNSLVQFENVFMSLPT